MIESMVSIYENRNNKFRPISEERAVLEMNIANGPDLAHCASVIQLSMTDYWKNSGKSHSEDWHFVRRAQNIRNFTVSKVIDRMKEARGS